MSKKTQAILWVALAIVGGLLLLWLLGWGVASVFGALGLGQAGRAIKEYVATERTREGETQTIEQAKRAQLARVSREAKEVSERQAERKKSDEAATASTVDGARTPADLDAAIDRELDALDRESGRIGTILLALLLGTMAIVCLLCLVGSAHAQPPTAAQRARAAKILRVLKKARRKIARLKSDHALQVKRLTIQHQAAIEKIGADLRACRAQRSIIARRLDPPIWPYLLAGIALGGIAVGGAWGISAAVGVVR